MIRFLLRLFVKDYEQTQDPAVRQRYGVFSGCLGMAVNTLLFLIIFLAGTITGSVSMIADALHNLSDAGSSLVTLISFKLSGRKPNKNHPFGHGRIEYLSGLLVALVILVVGVEVLKSSVDKILNPTEITFSLLSILILVFAIGLNQFMSYVNRSLGKRIGSPVMQASGLDSLTDSVSTMAVLAGVLVYHFAGLYVDGWVGVLVSLFILHAGYSAARDTINPLLGTAPDPALVHDIESTVLSHPEIHGVHDLVIHDYGPARSMMTLHAEVDENADLLKTHDVIDLIEDELNQKFSTESCIHMDPIDTENARTLQLRARVQKILQDAISPKVTIHDFRITPGPLLTNLIFDAVIPYDVKLTDEEAEAKVRALVTDLSPSFRAVVKIDRSYAR